MEAQSFIGFDYERFFRCLKSLAPRLDFTLVITTPGEV
jgi:hypothetical protein